VDGAIPFAHSIEMTYRLQDGALEVVTRIENHSTEPMPVAVGYHPYFRLHDAPRDQWTVHLAARDRLVLSKELIPTGEREPANFPDPMPLAGAKLDDVFSPLERDADGRAEFWVQGKRERISVIYGPKYTVAVVYAPAGRDFLCFEPMSAITNAFNLAHAGLYSEFAVDSAGRKLAGELLDQAQRLLAGGLFTPEARGEERLQGVVEAGHGDGRGLLRGQCEDVDLDQVVVTLLENVIRAAAFPRVDDQARMASRGTR